MTLSTAITLPPFLASIPICLFFEKVLRFISRGSAILEGNIIKNNYQEGIWCGGSTENERAYFYLPKEESNAVIRHNIISHNGLSEPYL
jgi:parallel beta-helix repeat protein